MMPSSTAYSQITGIDRDQKIILVTALNNYESLKLENNLLKKQMGFSEMQLALKQKEINQLNQKIDNLHKINNSQKTIISNQTKLIRIQKKKKIRNTIVGISIGVIIGVIIAK